jgi:hypothetical protein
MNEGLRTHRSASCRIAIATGLPEEMREAVREIVSMEASNPRKGHANGLLAEVCTEADQWWMTLIVQVRPFGASHMDEQRLERFYAKFDFEPIQRDPLIMARSPHMPMVVTIN